MFSRAHRIMRDDAWTGWFFWNARMSALGQPRLLVRRGACVGFSGASIQTIHVRMSTGKLPCFNPSQPERLAVTEEPSYYFDGGLRTQ